MNEIMTLVGVQTQKIIKTVVQESTPAIMSYLSKGKWHVAKVQPTNITEGCLSIESIRTDKKQRPINIQVGQPVGISFKHEYGKFVFDTTVIALEPSPQADSGTGGTIVLAAPEKIELIQRRTYYRVKVPESLKVRVILWPRRTKWKAKSQIQDRSDQIQNCCQGQLIDISAGGLQVIIPYQKTADAPLSGEDQPTRNGWDMQKPNFKKGQFVGIRFTPMPYETPLTLSAQIRNILPTADNQGISLGMQIVGLEASTEGHQALTRLIGVVGRYYQVNQSGAKQLDKEPATCAV